MIHEYRQIKDDYSKRDDVVTIKLTEIKKMRQDIETMESDIVKKEKSFQTTRRYI